MRSKNIAKAIIGAKKKVNNLVKIDRLSSNAEIINQLFFRVECHQRIVKIAPITKVNAGNPTAKKVIAMINCSSSLYFFIDNTSFSKK